MSHKLPLGTLAYQWPTPDHPQPRRTDAMVAPYDAAKPVRPDWVERALKEGDVKTSDNHVFVGGTHAEHRLNPGDYLLKAPDGSFHTVSATVFDALAGSGVDHTPQDDPDVEEAVNTEGPPYSAGVLARSATARAKQAAYEQKLLADANAAIARDASPKPAGHHNAAVEGADAPHPHEQSHKKGHK